MHYLTRASIQYTEISEQSITKVCKFILNLVNNVFLLCIFIVYIELYRIAAGNVPYDLLHGQTAKTYIMEAQLGAPLKPLIR